MFLMFMVQLMLNNQPERTPQNVAPAEPKTKPKPFLQ